VKDGQIDTSDILELPDWSGAVVGKFYCPVKQPVTIRIAADYLPGSSQKGRACDTAEPQGDPDFSGEVVSSLRVERWRLLLFQL
jgi:hypothetical protein